MLAVLAIVVTSLAAAPAAGPAPAEVREQARAILTDDYQRTLPGHEQVVPGEARDRGGPRASRRNHRVREIRVDGVFGTIARGLLLVVMVAVVLVFGLWLSRELVAHVDDPASAVDGGAGGSRGDPDAAVVARPLGDAEALAATGDYGAAVHTLLLRTLEELVARSRTPIHPSLTSREILARVTLPPEARGALGDLIGAVEISHFGGRTPGRDDFERCRARFQRFAQAYLGGRA